MKTDDQRRLYGTHGEPNAGNWIAPEGKWKSVVHDPRLLWPVTMSDAAEGLLYVTVN